MYTKNGRGQKLTVGSLIKDYRLRSVDRQIVPGKDDIPEERLRLVFTSYIKPRVTIDVYSEEVLTFMGNPRVFVILSRKERSHLIKLIYTQTDWQKKIIF